MNFLGLWGNRNSSVKTNKRAARHGTVIAPDGVPIPAEGSTKYQLRQFAESTLGKKSLKTAVALPEGEDLAEWVACHIVDFHNHLNMIFFAISHHCTEESCPSMTAGQMYEYLWADGKMYKKPTKLPASQYIKLLREWVNEHIDNPQIFPTDVATPFPPTFLAQLAPTIFRRLLRVYAHLYYHHYNQLSQLGLDTMLNTSFNHFTLFVTRWELVNNQELAPVKDIIKSMI